MEQKIKSVSEAFSMQPATYYIGQRLPLKLPSEDEKMDITTAKKIDFVIVDKIFRKGVSMDGQMIDFIIGWDKEGHTLFMLRAIACNLEFYV